MGWKPHDKPLHDKRILWSHPKKSPRFTHSPLLKYASHGDSHNTNCKAMMAFTHPDVVSMGVSSPHSSQARLGSSCSLLPLPGTCLSEFALTVASAAPGFLQLLSRPFHFTGQVSTCQSGLPWLPYLKYPPAILLLLCSTLISTWHSTCCFFSCFCLPPVIRMWTPWSQEFVLFFFAIQQHPEENFGLTYVLDVCWKKV